MLTSPNSSVLGLSIAHQCFVPSSPRACSQATYMLYHDQLYFATFLKIRHLKALANEDTLLRTQTFLRLPARATFVADTNFVSGTQKMFLILFRHILCPQQMFPSLCSMETQHSFCVPRICAPKKHHEQQCVRNNVSSFARAITATTNNVRTPIHCLWTTEF